MDRQFSIEAILSVLADLLRVASLITLLLCIAPFYPALGQNYASGNIASNENQSVYYTTRIEHVPNTTKYKPYGKTVATTRAATSMPPPLIHQGSPLKGEVKTIDESQPDEPVNQGCSATAETILQDAPPLGPVKGRTIPASVFRKWVEKSNGSTSAQNFDKDSITVIKGKWDHAEKVLEACGIPFSLTDANKFQAKLARARVLIINCPGDLSDTALLSVEKFVKEGGYLITTDWALASCLQPTFPHFIAWAGDYSNSEIVDAEAVEPNDQLFRSAVKQAPWKLDDRSQIVKLINKNKVDVLVRSRILSHKDGANLGILAATFRYGAGRVLHLVGHFNNNTGLAFDTAVPDPAPQIQVSLRQALALNFVLNGLSKH